MTSISRFLRDDSGATAIEYGVLVSLILVAIITLVRQIGTALQTQFSSIAGSL